MGKGWKYERRERGKGRAEGKDGGQESGCIEVDYNAEGQPKMKGTEEGEPRTHSGKEAETHWTEAQVPKATVRERRDRVQVTSTPRDGPGRFGQGSTEIRSYFRKMMNGGERRS